MKAFACQRRRHKHFQKQRPIWREKKKTVALICTFVARLTKVEVKTIGHTVSTMEMRALV